MPLLESVLHFGLFVLFLLFLLNGQAMLLLLQRAINLCLLLLLFLLGGW